MREISLRPYHGKLFVVRTKKEYEKRHLEIFEFEEKLTKVHCGRTAEGYYKDGRLTYLVYYRNTADLAHELSHVVLLLFERIGINPIEAKGEPFCYMLSQLMADVLYGGK